MKRKPNLYVLVNGEPRPCYDFLVWRKFMELPDIRVVKMDQCNDALSDAQPTVLTYFLGIDQGFHVHTKPILYETQVQGGFLHGTVDRYHTKEEALKGHEMWWKRTLESMGYLNEGEHDEKMGKSSVPDNVIAINRFISEMRPGLRSRSTEPGQL